MSPLHQILSLRLFMCTYLPLSKKKQHMPYWPKSSGLQHYIQCSLLHCALIELDVNIEIDIVLYFIVMRTHLIFHDLHWSLITPHETSAKSVKHLILDELWQQMRGKLNNRYSVVLCEGEMDESCIMMKLWNKFILVKCVEQI